MIARVWARLREAYEAELVRGASRYRYETATHGRVVTRPPRSFDVVAIDPATGRARTVLLGPRRIPLLAPLLWPPLWQVGLPMGILWFAMALARRLRLDEPIDPDRKTLVFYAALVVFFALAGRFSLRGRWRRLREQAYDRWAWRHAAAHEDAEAPRTDTSAP